jgi:hypothetical protein
MKDVPAVRMGDVDSAFTELTRVVDELETTLYSFQERLVKITRQEQTNAVGGKQSMELSTCELSRILRVQISRLRDMSERISDHSSALEL